MAIPTQMERRQRFHVSEPRLTSAGRQYTVVDDLATEIVTVNGGFIGCTCGLDKVFVTCPHIGVVEEEEKKYEQEAEHRKVYCIVFGIDKEEWCACTK